MNWTTQNTGEQSASVLAAARTITQAFPQNRQAWKNLADATLQSGDVNGAVSLLEDICARFPDSTDFQLQLYRAQVRANHPEAALAAARRACELAPDSADVRDTLLAALTATRNIQEAEALLAQTPPSRANAVTRLTLLLHRSDVPWADVATLCDDMLTSNPGHVAARYHKALALSHLGHGEKAAALLRPDDFTSWSPLEAPQGHNTASLCAAVREEVLSNPTLTADPVAHTTRLGKRTLKLHQTTNRTIPLLHAAIRVHIERYITNLSTLGSDDPFVTSLPQRASFESWAVVHPAEGHQIAHIHPNAWLSGVFYVSTPPGGEILVGDPGPKHAALAPWSIREIQPIAGHVLLFPSWTPHSTRPTHSGDLRIAVAFDVVSQI